MANNHCKWMLDAPNGKPSKLFKDIYDHLKDRKATLKLWAFTTTTLFKTTYPDMEKDENGEVTYDALNKALDLDKIFSESEKEMNKALDMGMVDRRGKPKSFVSADDAILRAEEFNKTAKKKIAVVRKNKDGKYETHVLDNKALAIAEADKNKARRELNVALIKILQRLGFDIQFKDDPSFDGVFDPLLAEKNATYMKTVIQVANGEKGLDALPEEACHLIMAGLRNHPLKLRLDAQISDDMVRRVLGEDYDSYRKEYQKGKTPIEDRLREEAEGKLLYQALTGKAAPTGILHRKSSSGIMTLLKRIWDYAKSLFKKASPADIDNAFSDAQKTITSIADAIKSGEIEPVIERDVVMQHEKLYKLSQKIDSAEKLAQEGETILSKKLYITQSSAKTSPKENAVIRKNISKIRNAIEKQHYVAASYRILRTIVQDMDAIFDELEQYNIKGSDSTDLEVISEQARLVERVTIALQGYIPYIRVLTNLQKLIDKGEINMDPEWSESIIDDAKKLMGRLRDLQDDLGELRFAVLKQLIKLYYGDHGEKPEGFIETDKFKWESVEMILRGAKRDIGWADTNFFSAGDSRNPLINVIHNIVVRQQASRNAKINMNIARVQEAQAKLHKAGYDNNFIFDLDKNGVPTGFYKSKYNFAQYELDRKNFIESLDPEVYDFYAQQQAIEAWERTHTELVPVGSHMERMPRLKDDAGNDMYIVRDFDKGWSKEQKEYYEAMIGFKTEMDELLPSPMRNLYLAPQVSRSNTQMFDNGLAGAGRTMWRNMKKKYAVVDENPEYSKGVEVEEVTGKKFVITDFDDNAIQRVPVYYVQRLDDMRDLSTDATRGMFDYICMAVNYSEMTKLASAMRLLKEHCKNDYAVVQTHGGIPIIDRFKAFKRAYKREYTKIGTETRTVRALNEYIDRQFFNDTKAKLGNLEIEGTDKSVNMDMLFNLFMRITSVSRMGFNVLSGITNATQGETQIITEATSGRFFNLKDLMWAKKEYAKMLLPYMSQFNSIDRHDKMYMLINTFNSSEDFFRDMQDRDFNKSAMKRVLGRGNVYFMNTMGEHYLHTAGMLMILNHEKVKRLSDKNKEVSLYDVIRQVHDKDGWRLELDDDIEFVNKNRAFLQNNDLSGNNGVITRGESSLLFQNLAIYINSINAGMHGGYSEAEKGNINRTALGRAILQFRQWMFGMYNKNFSARYYEASTGMTREGTYRTMFRWLMSTLWDLKNMSLKEALNHNHLSPEEKRNVAVAGSQAALFVLLAIFGLMTQGMKDKDDRLIRLLAYQTKRLELETGALVPYPPTFFKNIFTLIQSPAAGVRTLETLSSLFNLGNYWNEVRGGRYKGWNKALKALYTVTPIYNIHKVIDMKDYNYMFNIFN